MAGMHACYLRCVPNTKVFQHAEIDKAIAIVKAVHLRVLNRRVHFWRVDVVALLISGAQSLLLDETNHLLRKK